MTILEFKSNRYDETYKLSSYDDWRLHTPARFNQILQSMILPSMNQAFCICLYKPKMTCTMMSFHLKCVCVCFQLLQTGLACYHQSRFVWTPCSHVNAANFVLLKLQANPLHSRSDSCQHKYTHLLLCRGISLPPYFLWQRNTHTPEKGSDSCYRDI